MNTAPFSIVSAAHADRLHTARAPRVRTGSSKRRHTRAFARLTSATKRGWMRRA
ncbi:MAG TPA: hypothetical protein VK095_02690 [Beutenbergiaceae bacterium]|nr:hypothetical protein [Beutenbergiaceae bacterium]